MSSYTVEVTRSVEKDLDNLKHLNLIFPEQVLLEQSFF